MPANVKREDLLTGPVILAIRHHAEKEWPNEACGYIADGKYVPARNVAREPKLFFDMHPDDVLQSHKDNATAIVHSHPGVRRKPDGTCVGNCPSKEDMEVQYKDGRPWIIQGVEAVRNQLVFHAPFCFGDQLEPLPFIGREFRPNVSDCYMLARDWFIQNKNVKLPNFPRDELWWEGKGNFLVDLITSVGFTEIDHKKVKPGDGVIMSMEPATGKYNHCGIYVESGMVLHHLAGRYSRKEPIGRWKHYSVRYFRYGA